MNYYELNMECMMENRNSLFLEINKKIDNRINELEQIYTVETKDKNAALCARKGGVEYRLNSSYYPEREAEQWSKQYDFSYLQSVVLMFGLGNGLFVREIRRKKEQGISLFVYEPSFELFYFVLNNYDIRDIIEDDSVFLLVENIDKSSFYVLFERHLSVTNIHSQVWCIHPKYNEMYNEEYQEFIHQIKEHNRHALLTISTKKYFGMRYVENIIRNLNYLKESNRLLDYKDIIDTTIPAIVLAAGPSLRHDIDRIKTLKGRAYIFVVDRILDYALKSGVEPDFIVTIDPIKPIEYFTERDDVTTPLLCGIDSSCEILKHHKGKKVIVCSDDYIGRMYIRLKEQPPVLGVGNSVATVAFSVCRELGFKVIILAGQDLAYDGEYTHAGGMEKEETNSQDIYVEGIEGNQVKSRWDWYEFLRWYRRELEKNETLTVIDIKPRGAKIYGTINMFLEEVEERYLTKEFDPSTLKNIEPTFKGKKAEKISKYIEKGYDELDMIRERALKSIELCRKQIKGYIRYGNQNKSYEARFKSISRNNKLIYKTTIYCLLEHVIQAKSFQELQGLYEIYEDEKDNILSTYEHSIGIYEGMLEAIDFVKPLLEEVVDIS